MSMINRVILSMIEYYSNDAKRISHFLKVHSFAKLIGECENLDPKTLEILEIASVVHDIGIKPAEEKYNSTAGHYQEIEGVKPADEMLTALGIAPEIVERVKYLVAHHHTYTNVDGADYRILLEADFLVNAYEDNLSVSAIYNARSRIFRTKSGTAVLNQCFGLTAIYLIPFGNEFMLRDFFKDCTDSCTESFLQGKAGYAFADSDSKISCCAVVVGEYIYISGCEEQSEFLKDIFNYAKTNGLTIITLNEKIKALVTDIYGNKCLVKKRYQMSCESGFSETKLNEYINGVSGEFEIVPFDKNIYIQALGNSWSKYFVLNFRGYDDFEKNGLGYAVLHKGKLVSGTFSYSSYDKGYEIIVATAPEYQRRGLALGCASKFILETVHQGKIPHWDCANEKSLALSQKLGYRLQREYKGLKIEN